MRLLLELNADLSTKHSISSSWALSSPVYGMSELGEQLRDGSIARLQTFL